MENNEMPEGAWETEKPITEIAKFEAECVALYDHWDQIMALEAQVKELRAQADAMENRVRDTMKAHGMKKFHVTGKGTIGITNKYSWKIPQDLTKKREFLKYLQGKGVFLEMVSVNSQTLNKFCKEQIEIAKGEGKVDWNPDGLEPPTLRETITMRSK